ncbi:MAG: hypothetical protein KBG91_00640 [Syntrophomonadaceae bacterium]|nr:hypothetical protein [Syntrophomonadaceae bacterium]
MKMFIQREDARIVALFCFLSTVLLGYLALPLYADDGLQMKVKAGFGGYARSGKFTPVQVIVENNGPGITAYLEISTLIGEKQVLYRKAAVLASGSKKAIDMYIPVNAEQDYTVKLVSEPEKKLLAESRLRMFYIDDNLLVGVLGRSVIDLDYLEEIRLPGSSRRTSVAYLQEDGLPVNELLLDNINILVFYDYPMNRLSEQKSGAVREWVKRGGILVQGGDRFDSSVIAATGRNNELTGEKAEELVIEGNILYHQQLGKGSIYHLSHDAATGIDGMNLWRYLLNEAESSSLVLVRNINETGNTLGTALSTMPASDLPAFGWLAAIFLIYILILGPGAYLILKRFDRREWGWAVIPLLAVLLFSFTYLYGFKGKGWNAYTSIISVVRLEANNDYARVNSIMGAFAPTQSTFSIDLPGNSLVSLLPVDIGGQGSAVTNSTAQEPPLAAVVEQGKDTRVKFDDTTRWSMRCIRSEAFLDQPGAIAGNLQLANGKVSGTIKNLTGYRLNDCALISRYNYQYIGKLETGESVPINFQPYIHGQKGTALQTFKRLQENYPVSWPQQDRSIGLRDKEIKKQLTAMVAQSYDFIDNSLLLVGYSQEAVKGTFYENKTENRYAFTAFAAPLLLNNINDAGKISMPPGIVNARLVGIEGPDCLPDEWGYNLEQSHMIFQADLPCSPHNCNLDEVRIFVPGVDYQMQEALSIKVYNLVSGDWDEVGCKPAGSLLDNARQYVNENGSLRIKVANVTNQPSDNVLYFPGLTVSLEGNHMNPKLGAD